jgi:hypothetical protein
MDMTSTFEGSFTHYCKLEGITYFLIPNIEKKEI